MGACLSKKKDSALNPVSTEPVSQLKNSGNGVTFTLSKPTNPEMNLKKKTTQDQVAAKEGQNQVKKEIFIIKHRKSHDEIREKSPKIQPFNAQQNKSPHSDDGLPSKIAPSTPNIGVVGVRTSSCTKEEVDAILIQCGRLSRSSSGRAASSSAGGGRKYSGSKRSFDFDHCDNDANSADDDQRRANAVSATDNSDMCEDYDGVGGENRRHQHRERRRQSPRPSPSRRRTPSRERDQQNQRSSSRERRVSRSPGRRSSETNSSANSGNNGSNNNNAGSRPGKMVSVPATVSSLVMDKSNNGGGESGIKRITVRRNVGECGVVGSRGSASPRSQSPARGNGNAGNAKVVSDNHHHHQQQQQQQQQPSLSRNNSAKKAEQSPYRRNPLSEIDPNALSYPQPNTNNGSSKVQNRPKKEIEVEANQKPYALEKDLIVNYKTKELIEEEIKAMASMDDNHNVVVKTMLPSGVENLEPQNLTRSRSSRRSRDLDLNPEYESVLNNPTQSYTSLLLEDIQNFHQKNTQQPSISLPACLSKACSILEAVADLNSTTSSSFSNPPSYRNEHNNASSFGANNHHYGKNKDNTKDPFVESEVHVFDDVMEPSLHKYVTVKRGGSVCGVMDKNNNMEDQESSGSNSFFTQQHHFGISSNTWEANSADSTDSWTSRLMEGSDAVAEARKALSCKKRECDDHQHSSGIGRGRLNGSFFSSSSNKNAAATI